MIKINNEIYDDYKIDISFDPYEVTSNGNKRKGNALYITCISSDFTLSIETNYDKLWIDELKINDIKDISKYIIGLPFDDEKGWMYLTDPCKCLINRIDKTNYNINLIGTFNEIEELNIELNINLELK